MKAILQLFLSFFQSKKEAPDYITEIEQTIKKLQCFQSGKVFIITDNKKQELMTFLKKFSFTRYANAQIKRSFELYQGTYFLYGGVMNISRNSFNIDGMSRGNIAHGGLFYTFCSKLEEIIENKYETYLEENNLTEVDKELSENIGSIQTHLNNLRIMDAEELLNDMNRQIDLRKQNLPFFFKFQEKIDRLEKERKRIEHVSDSKKDIFERLSLCKNEYREYTVIPGNGKRTIIILYDIRLLEYEKAYYTTFLENYGFGGSILIEGHSQLNTFDQIMLQEDKLGALIHNTGMWHESTLDELFQYRELSNEEKNKLFNLPHNTKGKHGSEDLLCDEKFLDRIVNFF